MKNFILYALGALFLFATCQPDELQSDELVQTDDAILLKVTEAYENYKSNNKTDRSQTAKSPKANQVARKWTMKYSYGTRFDFVPNAGDCADFDGPTIELQIDGYGQGSLFGNFTFINRLCFPGAPGVPVPVGPPLEEEMRGIGTTAAGDQWYFFRTKVTQDPDNLGYAAQLWRIEGGSEGGRFERASGWLEIYGNPDLPDTPFVGEGVFIY